MAINILSRATMAKKVSRKYVKMESIMIHSKSLRYPPTKKKKNTKVAIGTSTVHGAPPNAGLANDFARLKAKFVDVVGRKT